MDERAIVAWGPRAKPDGAEHPTAKLSATVALVIGAAATLIFHAVADPTVAWPAWVGVPIAAIVGARYATRLERLDQMPVRQAMSMAVWCTVAGAFAVGVVTGGSFGLFLGVIGLLYLGVPVLLLLLLPAIAWACTTTFLARHGWG